MKIKKKLPESYILNIVSDLYRKFNADFFKSTLKKPSFLIVDSTVKHGHWSYYKNEIALASHLFTDYSNWYQVKLTLKHEMAHQYVDCVLGAAGEVDPHGKLFNQIAQEKEYEFLLEGEKKESESGSSIVAKIEKLLSLAQSNNKSEAENAMKFANKLMRKWNVDIIVNNKARNFTRKTITLPTKRRSYSMVIMAGLLREHFFVDTIWVWDNCPLSDTPNKLGYMLEILGASENVDIASYSFEFIMMVVDREFKKIKKQNHSATKQNFLTGVIHGFSEKLSEQVEVLNESTDIVYLKDPLLDEYFIKCHPSVKTSSFKSSAGLGDGFGEGRNVGVNLNIHKGISTNSNQGLLLN